MSSLSERAKTEIALHKANERIALLESALRWEAGEEGCEHYWSDDSCVQDKPESPDLWCRYCRIINLLEENNEGN